MKSQFIDEAIRLGEHVEAEWKLAQFDDDAFPSIAEAALKSADLSGYDCAEVASAAVISDDMPAQHDPKAEFGQPPLTLFAGRQSAFFVQLLHWFDGAPDIHDHTFGGAFAVVQGSSIHTTYAFDSVERVNRALVVGRLTTCAAEVLRTGSIRRIVGGRGFIHSTFHIDSPSVTLVVRTIDDRQWEPHRYWKCGLAEQPYYSPPTLARRLQLLSAIAATSPGRYEATLVEACKGADAYSAYRYLAHAYSAGGTLETTYHRARSAVGDRLGQVVDVFHRSYLERTRVQFIVRRRSVVQDSDHRFLLGLLTHGADRRTIVRLTMDREHAPDESAAIRILAGWIEEIATLREPNRAPTQLGLDLDPTSLECLLELVQGYTAPQVAERLALKHEISGETREEIFALCEALRSAPLFEPMFRL